jgi:hypothetical protein
MNLKKLLLFPEGESGAGGGGSTAVVDAPKTEQSPGGTDLSEMSMGDAIASTFKSEPRQRDRREPRKETKTETKTPEKKAEVKPEAKPETKTDAPQKRTSIFDGPEQKPETSAAKAVDISPEADDALPENDWKAAKAVRQQLRTRLAELEEREKKNTQELTRYREVVPDTAEVQRLREEHKVFSEKVALLDYQNHPEFRKQFTEPKEKLNGEIKTILADNGIDGFDLKAVLALPRAEMAKRISEVTDKLNSYDAGEFRLQLREYGKLTSAEQTALGTHKEALANLGQINQAKQRTAFEGKWKSTSFATFAQKLEPPEGSTPDEVAQIRALNQGIDTMRSNAEKYAFSLGDESQAAEVAIKASNYDFVVNHAFPRMQSDYKKLQGQYQAVITKLQELAAHKPGTDFAGGSAAKPEAPESLPIKDQVKRVFRS